MIALVESTKSPLDSSGKSEVQWVSWQPGCRYSSILEFTRSPSYSRNTLRHCIAYWWVLTCTVSGSMHLLSSQLAHLLLVCLHQLLSHSGSLPLVAQPHSLEDEGRQGDKERHQGVQLEAELCGRDGEETACLTVVGHTRMHARTHTHTRYLQCSHSCNPLPGAGRTGTALSVSPCSPQTSPASR